VPRISPAERAGSRAPCALLPNGRDLFELVISDRRFNPVGDKANAFLHFEDFIWQLAITQSDDRPRLVHHVHGFSRQVTLQDARRRIRDSAVLAPPPCTVRCETLRKDA
jgi:hypothetical protein